MSDDRDDLEFGPSGYLPERASKRARKIVLRAPLGMHWIWASVVAGLIVLVAGVLFLQRADQGPQPPFQELVPLAEAETGTGLLDGERILLVTDGGRPRVFAIGPTDDIDFCDASRRLEATDGRVWSLTGRGFGDTASLTEHPTVVSDGVLYVDLTSEIAAPPASTESVAPAC